MRIAKAIALLALAFCLACVGLVAWQVIFLVRESRLAVKELDQFLNHDQRGITGVFSNTNAFLVQMSLSADQWRRASEEQRAYWQGISKQAGESLTKTNATLDALHQTLGTLNTAVGNLDQRTLAEVNLTLAEARATIIELRTDSKTLLEKSGASIDAAGRLLKNSDKLVVSTERLVGVPLRVGVPIPVDQEQTLALGLANLDRFTLNLDRTGEHVEETTAYVRDMFRPTRKSFWHNVTSNLLPAGIGLLIPQKTIVSNTVRTKATTK